MATQPERDWFGQSEQHAHLLLVHQHLEALADQHCLKLASLDAILEWVSAHPELAPAELRLRRLIARVAK